MIHHLVPAMRDRGWGRVIHIGSRNAISPHNNMPPYGASKAGVNNLSLGLSKELAFTGVTSNVIMPGLIHTVQLDELPIVSLKAVSIRPRTSCSRISAARR